MNSEEQGQSLLEVLDELTALVRNARSVPMSASAIVNRSEVLDLLSTAQEIIPDQIVAADGLIKQADSVTAEAQQQAKEILERAHNDAEDTIQEAREQASRLVSQDSVTVAAKAQAQRILDEAKSHAEKLKRGADEYSDQTLLELQSQVADLGNSIDALSREVQAKVDDILSKITAGRNVIASRMEDAEQPDAAPEESAESGDESWT
ncbi:MAG: hypothetical protein LKJ57_06970 [Ancrocorticia sp.]|jgi:cell division septum initiation protein DivIVA|nr:hypothetical protein [Ancrocorticia sp.]MCI1895775.1 hypothetical protein [Ancrocorticia sp.]MCI1932769.1 hypothetical protein [Ancrocorticia sp.]MCI1964192.1 hypothetical protein [Ancrocorticia sp.]MCI2002629.1 hypothetical protein [Ancrocorticia sp.]